MLLEKYFDLLFKYLVGNFIMLFFNSVMDSGENGVRYGTLNDSREHNFIIM